jgi:hypothetical protein
LGGDRGVDAGGLVATVVGDASVVGVAAGLADARRVAGLAGGGFVRGGAVGAGCVAGGAAVVVGAAAVVVGTTEVGGEEVAVTSAAPMCEERCSGASWDRRGTPAMATPTAAHTTSMSTVIDRCPGLTAGPSYRSKLRGRSAPLADPAV